MDEQLRLLIELQEIDAKIRAEEREQQAIPRRLADIDRRTAAASEDLGRVKESLEAAQKAKRERDRDLEDGGRKVEKLKARTSEIKTNKEYQALLKEIETAEHENKAIEDDILALMEKMDAAAAQMSMAEERMRTDASAIQAERGRHEARAAELDVEVKRLAEARAELAARIDAAALGSYERLKHKVAGNVVVEARDEACSGCYMSIPPQVFVNVKKNSSIIDCPNCHRILYFKEFITQK